MFPNKTYPPCYENLFDGAETQDLIDGIVDRFDESSIRMVLSSKDVSWDHNVAQLGTFPERVFGLIQKLKHQGQLHWLVFVVDEVRPGYQTFVTLRAKATPPLPSVGAPPPQLDRGGNGVGTGDPWRVVLLRNNRPFLDRIALREEFRLVGLGNAKPILSVTGPPDTGKSYSARYLVDVARSLDEHQTLVPKEVLLDRLNGVVEVGASADVGGLRLASRLASAIADQPLPRYIEESFGSEQDTTWAADAANWIIANVAEGPIRWVIFDGFQSTVLSPSAQSLINSIIDEVAREGRIRIALLGYPGNLSWCAASVREVRLDLEDFTDQEKLKNHVLEYLIEVRDRAVSQGMPAFTEDQLLAETRRVLSQTNPREPDLHALEAALTEIAERLLVGS